MWSLVTENKSGIRPSDDAGKTNDASPATIDAGYNVGFTFARQYGLRVTKTSAISSGSPSPSRIRKPRSPRMETRTISCSARRATAKATTGAEITRLILLPISSQRLPSIRALGTMKFLDSTTDSPTVSSLASTYLRKFPAVVPPALPPLTEPITRRSTAEGSEPMHAGPFSISTLFLVCTALAEMEWAVTVQHSCPILRSMPMGLRL